MGVVDGSIHWNGQNNFVDFIQFHAERLGMTREEYMAHFGSANAGINETKKKPGPDPYHRGLDDEEVEDKEAQIKKQAKMDDDDPDAYKEMPGDKEAREKGEVKTSKATKAYSKLYGEDLDEGVMGDLHQMANEIGDEDKFVKAFFKEYGDKVKKSKDSEDWVRSLYRDTIQESLKTQKLQKELSKVETWVRKSGLDYDDWDWDGEELTIFTKDGTEKYSKKDLKDEGVFESKVNEISNKNAEKYSKPLRKLKNPKKIRNIAAGRGKYDDMLVWLSHNAKNLDYHLDGQGQLHVNGEDYEMVRTELNEKKSWALLNPEKGFVRKIAVNDYTKRPEQAAKWKDIKSATKAGKEFTKYHGVDVMVQAMDESVSEVNHTGSEASDKMAFSQLERIIDYATMIRDRMAAGKGLDAWMYGKVIKAEDYLNTLYDVIDGDDGVVETQKMNKKDWKKIKPFNKHITKDGEKFVMSYDDRIGTFLEPVEIVDEAFKLGKKNQYTIDDVNVAYGFWGTLETSGFKSREIEDCMHSAMAWLTENYRFSDAGALYYLNAKAGRWIADQVIEQKGRKDVVDVLEDYATDVEWKKWSKEYNKYAQEEMMSEAKRGDIHKAAKKGSYPATVVVISSGMVVKQELVKTPAAVPAVFNELQKEYPNSVISVESKTGEVLFSESVVTEADDEEQKSTDRGPLDDDKIETALKKKAKDTGVPIGIIRAVMRRGLAAWKSGHRPGANQQQWGYARVNAFLTKGEGTWGKADKDLAKEVRDGGHDKKLKKA